MADRSILGAADVTDAELAAIVAGWLGHDAADVELLESSAEEFPYDLDAITTAGRFWVEGKVGTPSGAVPFRFFVKHVQSWSRSPFFEFVPPDLREWAEGTVPWYTEPLIYRSDLRDRLPPGLTMPRAVAVRDIDDRAAVVWLEPIDVVERSWATEHLVHAAYLLGRMAASPSTSELSAIGEPEPGRRVWTYVEGRLAVQVLPMLYDDEIWRHPLIAGAFDGTLKDRLRRAADAVPSYLAELESMTFGAAHGDACTNNILVQRDADELALIDYGFWSTQPIGFDLGQLLLGDVQIGRRPAACLHRVEAACLPAYVEGLRDEGCAVPTQQVRRAHAILMLFFTGLSSFPLEHLPHEPTPERHRIAAERAAMARFILDLVDAT
ncbi:MAG: phosphotransferase [Actinomycetales bacterium]